MSAGTDRRRAPGVAARMLLLVAGLAVGLGAAEIMLRVVGYEGENERRGTVFRDDLGQVPRAGWIESAVFDPETVQEIEIGGQMVRFDKQPAVTRVLFVGDSGTHGGAIEPRNTFARLFGDMVGWLARRPVEVINAGVVGLNTIGEYRLIADYLVTLDPDIVVVGLFMANDINFNLAQSHLLDRQSDSSIGWSERLRQRSALAHFIFLQTRVAARAITAARAGVDDDPNFVPLPFLIDEDGTWLLHYRDGEIATYRVRYSPTIERAFELLREVFLRLIRLSESEGFQLVVLIIPTSSDLAGELKMFVWPQAPVEIVREGMISGPEELDVGKPARRVLAMCRELGLVCVDPRGALRGLAVEDVILPGDDHLSGVAHEIVASVLLRHFDVDTMRFVEREGEAASRSSLGR